MLSSTNTVVVICQIVLSVIGEQSESRNNKVVTLDLDQK